MILERPEGNKLTGVYRGTVICHLPHGKLKVFIPTVYAAEWETKPEMLPAAEQLTPLYAGTNKGNGVFSYPNIGSTVLCQFINGDQNLPLVIGATLGGHNAFGQYDQIFENHFQTSAYLSSSPRHIITSGKSHTEMFEKGILCSIVEDPDRRDTSAEFDPKIHSISSTSNVKERPIADKVYAEELSNIWCRSVLDNDGETHGYSYLNTHWLDLGNINDTSAQYVKNTNITTDIQHRMSNDGKINETILSSGTFFEQDGKAGTNIDRKFTITNKHLAEIPNKIAFTTDTQLTSLESNTKTAVNSSLDLKNINVISEELSGKILLSTDTILTSSVTASGSVTTTNITSDNHILEDSEGLISLVAKHNSLSNVTGGGSSTTILQNGVAESTKHITYGHKNSSKYELTSTINNATTVVNATINSDNISSKDVAGNLSKSNYKFMDLQAKLVVDSKLISEEEIGKNSTQTTQKLSQLKTSSGSEVINSEVIDKMDTNVSKIEKRVTNKLAANACENSIIMDAGTGTMDIKLLDNVSGTKCTFKLEKSGVLTIVTDMEVNVITNKTLINSPGGVDIIGNTTITGTLDVTGNVTSQALVTDSGCTLGTHQHVCPSHGATTTPGFG